MRNLWKPCEIAQKADSEGGWFSFHRWGGLVERTGDPEIDKCLQALQYYFNKAEHVLSELTPLLPEPWCSE